MKSLNRPQAIRQLAIHALNDLKARKELELADFKCTSVGRWLEFKVFLRGDHSFLMYFGATRKVLNHCRRMCRTGRHYVQGVTINFKDSLDDIKSKIANCIISVRQAFSCGNRAVVSRPDDADSVWNEHHLALPPKATFLMSSAPLPSFAG